MSEKPKDIFDRIAQSSLLAQFTTAFEAATGLPLGILCTEVKQIGQGSEVMNPFCRMLNENESCFDCSVAIKGVIESNDGTTKTLKCFAGLKESFVPIFAGQTTIGYLTTGQVFVKGQREIEWPTVADRLAKMGRNLQEIDLLEESWKQSRTLSSHSYGGAVSLMAVFSQQLSGLADRIMMEAADTEPIAVVKARRFISANLSEDIDLNQVSAHVGMSTYHFCRVFKNVTGMTFKQYLTRRRVEWAKCRLRRPGARATEVAFEVGFGSLSQFNRSFQQIVGTTPSEWRLDDARRLAAAL